MYRVFNNSGVSQCGCELVMLPTFDEVQEYCDEHYDDLINGYITIEACDEDDCDE